MHADDTYDPLERVVRAAERFLVAHYNREHHDDRTCAEALRELRAALAIDYIPLSIRDNPAAVAAWSQGADYDEAHGRP